MRCKICHNDTNNVEIVAKEMMFGLDEQFKYFQCSNCQCLQIAEIPQDMSKYYSESYYSYSMNKNISIKHKLKSLIRRKRNQYAILNNSLIGRALYNLYPCSDLKMLSEVKLHLNSKILDIGCGDGAYLLNIKEIGFDDLLGVDPFIKDNILYDNGLQIQKKSIQEVDGKWDLIMFHHSLEHIEDQHKTIETAFNLLSDNGTILIRIPSVSSYAWENYRENWVQLEAPRHFYLHSHKSIKLLIEKYDMTVEKTICDSTIFQFWASEQYKAGIALKDGKSYSENPNNSIFSKTQINQFIQMTNALNIQGQGDSFAYFIRKKRYLL